MANSLRQSNLNRPRGGSSKWLEGPAGAILQLEFFGSPAQAGDGYIDVFVGASWQRKPIKVWNGSSWQVGPIKRWDGLTWVTN